MHHICQTMHIEISRVVATDIEREREREKNSLFDCLSAGTSPSVVSPKFNPSFTPLLLHPPSHAFLTLQTRIRSDDASNAAGMRLFVASNQLKKREKEKLRGKEKEKDRRREKERESAAKTARIVAGKFTVRVL